jgi:transcriptional regulator with XRE-family HTH domain
MELHNVRADLRKTLNRRRLTQEAFARKHDLSSSWLNKFLLGKVENPQLRSLERVQKAIEAESP